MNNQFKFIEIEKIYNNLDTVCDTCLCFANHDRRSSTKDYNMSRCIYKNLESEIKPILNNGKTFIIVRINSAEGEYFFKRLQSCASPEYIADYLQFFRSELINELSYDKLLPLFVLKYVSEPFSDLNEINPVASYNNFKRSLCKSGVAPEIVNKIIVLPNISIALNSLPVFQKIKINQFNSRLETDPIVLYNLSILVRNRFDALLHKVNSNTSLNDYVLRVEFYVLFKYILAYGSITGISDPAIVNFVKLSEELQNLTHFAFVNGKNPKRKSFTDNLYKLSQQVNWVDSYGPEYMNDNLALYDKIFMNVSSLVNTLIDDKVFSSPAFCRVYYLFQRLSRINYAFQNNPEYSNSLKNEFHKLYVQFERMTLTRFINLTFNCILYGHETHKWLDNSTTIHIID